MASSECGAHFSVRTVPRNSTEGGGRDPSPALCRQNLTFFAHLYAPPKKQERLIKLK